MNKRHLLSTIALGAVAAVALAGCSGSAGGGKADAKHITIGVFNGWPEGEAASYVWKEALEAKGYSVDLEYADAGPVFAGLAKGDYDVALDGWLPVTHKSYFDKYGSKITDLGAWNKDAKLTVAVNKDAKIDSLDQLAAASDDFGGKLIGIEPGAGLTEITQKKVIPEYGLDKMDFVTSSTPAMLAELKKAIDAKKDIAVTLWRPHWAYDAFPIKDLKDPKGALGAAESIHTVTRKGFDADHAEVNAWLKKFTMKSDLLFSLENKMYNNGGKKVTDYGPVVKDWMKDNKEFADSLTS